MSQFLWPHRRKDINVFHAYWDVPVKGDPGATVRVSSEDGFPDGWPDAIRIAEEEGYVVDRERIPQ